MRIRIARNVLISEKLDYDHLLLFIMIIYDYLRKDRLSILLLKLAFGWKRKKDIAVWIMNDEENALFKNRVLTCQKICLYLLRWSLASDECPVCRRRSVRDNDAWVLANHPSATEVEFLLFLYLSVFFLSLLIDGSLLCSSSL